MPTIKLNGHPHELAKALTVSALLASLDLRDKPVIVELDGKALSKSEHAATHVDDGAKVEVITLAAGG